MPRPLVERFDIPCPGLPPSLEGLRVLHLTDPHAGLTRGLTERIARLGRELAALPMGQQPELVAFTGDAMDRAATGRVAIDALLSLDDAARGALPGAQGGRTTPVFAVFGNHDAFHAQDALRRETEERGWHWLLNTGAEVGLPGRRDPIRVLGASHPEDAFAAAASMGLTTGGDSPARYDVLLCHFPNQLYAARQMGIGLVLAGHTHAGQIRFGPRNAPHTSSDLPSHLASGCLALGRTRCCVARGLGETAIPLRLNCPPQAPLYRLHAPAAGSPGAIEPRELEQLIPW